MQVTETLSDGLKRGFTVVVPAADIESAPHRAAGRSRQDAAPAGLPARQGAAAGGPAALRHGGHRRGAGGIGQRGDPAGAERARAAPGAAAEDRRGQPGHRDRRAKDLEFKVELELLPDIALPDFCAIELTRLKAEAPPEMIDKALAEHRRSATASWRRSRPRSWTSRGGAEKGEVLTVDFVGKIDGEPFPSGRRQRHRCRDRRHQVHPRLRASSSRA